MHIRIHPGIRLVDCSTSCRNAWNSRRFRIPTLYSNQGVGCIAESASSNCPYTSLASTMSSFSSKVLCRPLPLRSKRSSKPLRMQLTIFPPFSSCLRKKFSYFIISQLILVCIKGILNCWRMFPILL